MNKPIIKAFHDSSTGTISYVVEDPKTKNCAVIDSVLDFDISSGRTSTKNADEIIEFIKSNKLNLEWIIETHVHADHLSAAPYIQDKIGGKLVLARLLYWSKILLVRYLMLELNLKEMEVSSINYSKIMTHTKSVS